MDARPHLALTGPMGTGKTTIATALERHYAYRRLSWATPLKDFAAAAYGPINKDATYTIRRDGHLMTISGRALLQQIGTDALRRFDEDFWLRIGLRTIDAHPDGPWVVDDSRFPNETAALRRRGFVIVGLIVDPAIRAARLGLTPTELARLSDHPSEQPLLPDITIRINGSAPEPKRLAEAIIAAATDYISPPT